MSPAVVVTRDELVARLEEERARPVSEYHGAGVDELRADLGRLCATLARLPIGEPLACSTPKMVRERERKRRAAR